LGQQTINEDARKDNMETRIMTQVEEVFAQTRLLRWSIPGIAHFFTMWGFFILASVYLEALGVLFYPKFAIPIVGTGAPLASFRTSSRWRCWQASPRSRSSASSANPRRSAARAGSMGRTPAAPGSSSS
jgi:hypothetical protein